MADIDYQSSDDRKCERGPVLRKLFGPSREEVWNLLARQVGGQFKAGEGWTGPSRVDGQARQGVVTLDTFVVSRGQSTVTFGVDEPKFHSVGTIEDLIRLGRLSDLFAATLDRLCHIGSADEDDPGARLWGIAGWVE